MTQEHTYNGLAGCVVQRRSRTTGHLVGLYHAQQAGMDPASGAWATVCEEHATICNHGTLALARSHLGDPTMWCEACRDELAGRTR
ncbi:hypothetical protein [Burkholderia vietnamiensis]|uniref:hypothetical protein n=1 Tax=Burkholderia vietnamiensis TaxID=60552 RepID=UPI001CF3D8BA|nr:hypothetical protein [Burkholderia vietnamiensis]MCA8448877.1 hypothetical protein [Burkholderia vietnamiensis]